MAPRAARLLTSCIVVGLCVVALWRGVDFVRFARAGAGLAASPRAQAVRPWVGAPGLTSTALEASLAPALDARDRDGVRRRLDDIAAALARRPLAPTHWLSLAGARLVAGEA